MNAAARPDPFRPRWSKVFSDLWGSKFRTLLVVASIAVGVFAIGVITAAYSILAADIDQSYAAVNPGNIVIWTDAFDETFLKMIEDIPGVEQAEGRRMFGVRTSLDGIDWQSQGLVAVEDFDEMQVGLIDPLAGTDIARKGEVLVSKDFMNDTGYQVGDQLYVEFPNDKIERLPLVGLIADQAGGGDPAQNAALWVRTDTLESLGQPDARNRLYVTIAGAGTDLAAIDALAAVVKDKIERDGRSVYRVETTVSTEHPQRKMALAVFGVLGALGVLITVLSGALIINTLNALLVQQTRQIGVMKLVGGSSRQILGMYLSLIIAYGVLALLLAVPAGALGGYALAEFMAYMMNVKLQGFRIVPLAIVLQALIAFLIPLVSGYFPVHRGSKINVRQAISNTAAGGQPATLGWLNAIARLLPWLSRPVLLSVRNTFRQKGRLALTIFTLTVAGAIFIAVFNVRDSLNGFMDQLARHFMGDVTVNFSQAYPIARVEKALKAVPWVQGIEPWGGSSGEIWDQNENLMANISLVAPPADSTLIDPDIVAGRWLQPGEAQALVVSDAIYDIYPDLQPGQRIQLKLPGKRQSEWTVVGVFRFVDTVGDIIGYVDLESLSRIQGLEQRAGSYRLITGGHTLEEQKAAAQYLEKYLAGRQFLVGSIEAGAKLQADSAKGIDVLVSFLLIMALLTAFVGSIGLTGTMGMNVLERTREIGVMRAIGAVDLEIIKSVVIEGMMIGMITWVLAIFLSFPISSLLLDIISSAMMGSEMEVVFTPVGIYLWLGVVVALSFFASILPARSAARLTINEVLAYE